MEGSVGGGGVGGGHGVGFIDEKKAWKMEMQGLGRKSWCQTPTATQQGPLPRNLDILIASRHLTFLILHRTDDDVHCLLI